MHKDIYTHYHYNVGKQYFTPEAIFFRGNTLLRVHVIRLNVRLNIKQGRADVYD